MPNKEIVHNAPGSPAQSIRSCAVRSTPPPTWSWSVANDPGLPGGRSIRLRKLPRLHRLAPRARQGRGPRSSTPTPAPKSSTSCGLISSSPADAIRSAPPALRSRRLAGGLRERQPPASRAASASCGGAGSLAAKRHSMRVRPNRRMPGLRDPRAGCARPRRGGAPALRLNAAEGAVCAVARRPLRDAARAHPNRRAAGAARSGAVLVHGQVKRAGRGRGGARPAVPALAGSACVPTRRRSVSWALQAALRWVSPAAATGFVRCSACIEPRPSAAARRFVCAAEPERL